MKKVLNLLFALFIVFGISENISAQQESRPNAPEITFANGVHDYGNVVKGGNGECEFTFTNTGKEPLILTDVRSSCGCTVPKWPNEPIMPGQKGSIKVKYDTNRIGAINKSVTVLSNAKNATVTLRIKGTVLEPANETVPTKKLNEGSPVAK
ncbi:MAG: hypothetical protein A2X12_07980 [Bacteroidetes bacterium GWE2_29_8]|nr:MAG: hypothetical protein A2X12_07980 [Bacteroidetes bacterium GWE2_29_8]OFY16184.1 MAG: hypothetical protein A2X02_07220 [Bacteroidetes bacterium GWF2_29_10]